MQKICLFCGLIFVFISTVANATIDHGYNNPRGFNSDDSRDFNSDARIERQTGKNKSSETCGVDEFLTRAFEELPKYLLDNDDSCFRFLFDFEHAAMVYSEKRYLRIAQAAEDAAHEYDGTQSVANYFKYLRAANFIAFFYPDSVDVSDDMQQAMEDAMVAFQESPDFATIETINHFEVLSEWVSAADGTGNWALYYETVKAILSEVSEARTNEFWGRAIYNDALFFLFRGQQNDSDEFIEQISTDTEIAGILENLITDDVFSTGSATLIATNAIGELGRLLQWPDIRTSVRASIQTVLDQLERLSKNWFALIAAVENRDEDCTAYTPNICVTSALIAETTKLALPNRFVLDGGAMLFETALSASETEQIYYQLKEVEAVFFKVTGATRPVPDDVNDVITFRIYGSLQDYDTFQTFLFDLPSDNGGIYIEREATLYTWDRTPSESIFTLEELARHEYTHYLTGRYLIPGLWRETEMYDNDRLTWFDEGIANFVAGGTQADGVWPLKSLLGRLSRITEHYTPQEATDTDYDDPYLYPYATLILNFLQENQSNALQQLIEHLQTDNIDGFDTTVKQIDALSEDDFNAYINDWVNKADTIADPWKIYPSLETLSVSTASDIQDLLKSVSSSAVDNIVCIDASETQFECDMRLEYRVRNNELPLFELHEEIDALTTAFLQSESNNLQTINCFGTDIGSTSHTIRCQGRLNTATVNNDETDTSPTTDGNTPTDGNDGTDSSAPTDGGDATDPIDAPKGEEVFSAGAILHWYLLALLILGLGRTSVARKKILQR